MDYAQQQRNPGKHTVGLGIVIALHVLLGWAIVSGLARKVVDVIKAPIETKIIEEVQPPPPPPPENLPPPPKFAPPPPSFVPPPEVVVNNPPPAPASARTSHRANIALRGRAGVSVVSAAASVMAIPVATNALFITAQELTDC